MPIDLLLFAVSVGLMLAVGVPAIRFGVWLPRRLELETIPDAALTPAQAAHFARIDAAVASLGYTSRFNFSVTNMQGPTLTRVYLSEHAHAVLGAHCLRSASVIDESVVSGQNWLEWNTRYEDGTSLYTRNAEISSPFDRMPHQIFQECVGVADPVALKARHDERAAALLARQPRFPHGRDLLQEFRDYHERWCEFQAGRGLLVLDAAGERYHASVRTALRGVANFLNPLADNFTLSRFALGVLLGLGLPLIAAWALDAQAPLRPAGFPLWPTGGPVGRLATLAFAYALAGAAIGYLFTTKAFIWAALLGYVALRVTGAYGPELLLAVFMGFVAERVSQLRVRRALLV